MPRNGKATPTAPISTPSNARGGEWAVKIEKALQIRQSSAEARKGRPMSFPAGLRRR
jgi:hypothetical protein